MTDYMTVIADESERFLRVARDTDPAVPVPTCPEWSAGDLLWHLTEVHAFWARILRSGARTDEQSEAVEATVPPRPERRDVLVDLFEEETAALLTELTARDDDDPAWFWLSTAQSVGSIRRMQAHEATMHRVDAETAAGVTSAPIDAALAGDGVAHGVEVMWAWWSTLPGFTFAPADGVVALVASDLERSWHARPGRWNGVGQSGRAYDEPGAVLVDDGTPSATVTGTAEELVRWLWGRGPEPRVDGDPATLAAFREAQQVGMQ